MWWLMIINLASASPESRVTKMVANGSHEDAIWIAEGWLAKHEGHTNEALVVNALIDAWVIKATAEKDLALFRGLRERFVGHSKMKRVHQLEAQLGWELVSVRTSTREDVENWIQLYSTVIQKPESMTLVADRAFREAKLTDSSQAWNLFLKDFPYDDRIPKASDREERAAYREMRDDGSLKGYQRFLERYPDHPHRNLVARDILERWSVLDVPCDGAPPRCQTLPEGSQIAVSWDRIPGRSVTARVVGRLGTMTEPLDESYSVQSVLSDDFFSLTLPRELPIDWTQFYAVELTVKNGMSHLLPFDVQTSSN